MSVEDVVFSVYDTLNKFSAEDCWDASSLIVNTFRAGQIPM